MTRVHHLAVWIAALFGMVVGILWYSPFLFESQWMTLSGMTAERLEKVENMGLGLIYGLALVLIIVQAYLLAWFLIKTQSKGFFTALPVALGLWFLVSCVMAGGMIWEGMSIVLLGINSGCYLAQIIVMTAILCLPLFRK